MANPSYQRPYDAAPYAPRERPGLRTTGGLMLGRAISAVAARLLSRQRTEHGVAPRGRDVLWRAKRNAFSRALAEHGVTEGEAARILRLLGLSGTGICELSLLGALAGAAPATLDRTLPLMGLHNLVTIEERSGTDGYRPEVYVVVTEHGLRYARESAPLDGAPDAGAPGADGETASEATV